MPNGPCSIGKKVPWELNPRDISELYEFLSKKTESSGVIELRKSGSKMISKRLNREDIKKGDSDSVLTPLDIVNFHTHPYECYINEKVIWGWPSGEDLGQCISWALAGNIVHLVLAVEGLYSIEINPCFLKYLKKLNSNYERGLIIAFIETLGKSTHELRGLDVNLVQKVNPSNWIKFVNGLTVNFDNTKCGVIRCNEVTTFYDNKAVYENLSDYLTNYYFNGMEIPITGVNGEFFGIQKVSKNKFLNDFNKLKNVTHNFSCGHRRTAKTNWDRNKIFYVKLFKHDSPKQPTSPQKRFNWLKNKIKINPPSKKCTLAYFESISGSCKPEDTRKKRFIE